MNTIFPTSQSQIENKMFSRKYLLVTISNGVGEAKLVFLFTLIINCVNIEFKEFLKYHSKKRIYKKLV